LPIGNLTSQHWANVYLHPLDLFAKQELGCCKPHGAYLRYSDDFLFFAAAKPTLHRWRSAAIDFAAGLRLTLHEHKAQIFPVRDGISFLGWRVFPHYKRLRRENVRHAVRRLRQQQLAYARGELSLDDLSASVQAWLAHAAHGETYQLRRRIMGRFVFQVKHARDRSTTLGKPGREHAPSA
jgi:hypothetical protein